MEAQTCPEASSFKDQGVMGILESRLRAAELATSKEAASTLRLPGTPMGMRFKSATIFDFPQRRIVERT